MVTKSPFVIDFILAAAAAGVQKRFGLLVFELDLKRALCNHFFEKKNSVRFLSRSLSPLSLSQTGLLFLMEAHFLFVCL